MEDHDTLQLRQAHESGNLDQEAYEVAAAALSADSEDHTERHAEVRGSGAIAEGPGAVAIGRDAGPIHTGIGNIIQNIKPSAIQAIYQELGRLLQRHRRLVALTIVLEIPLGLLFFLYKDRFTLSWWAYLLMAILLTPLVVWSWIRLFGAQPFRASWRSWILASALTIVWSGLLGQQVWSALYPSRFPPDQFGIAVATFGEGPDFRVTRRGRQISGLLYSDLDEAVTKTPELSRSVVLTRIGVVRDIKQGLVDGERVGAKLVLWGQILERYEGVVVHFQVLETPNMTDNPSYPQTMPLTRRYLQSTIDVEGTETLTVKQIASPQSLAISAFSLGLYYYLAPDYNLAAEQFKIALEHLLDVQQPAGVTDLGLVYYYLGKSYQMLGRFEQSQEMLDKAADIHPDDPAIVLGQMYNYRAMGKDEQKQRALERAIALCNQRPSDEIPALYDRALAYEAMDDYEAALRDYRAIIDHKPDFFIAYLSAARVLVRLDRPGDIQDARDLYEKARVLVEDDRVKQVWIELDMGQLFEKIGQKDAAIQAYQRAVDLDPTLVTPYYYLAKLYEQMGVVDAALIYYRKLIEVSYNPSWAHETLAGFLYRMGDYSQAIEHYHEAVRYPVYSDALIHTNLGRAYAAADEQDVPDKESRALAEFAAALENPGVDESYIRSEYGIVLAQFGHIYEAIAQFERSLELDPGIGFETKLNLGQLREAIGEPEEAKALYESLIALSGQISPDKLEIAQDRLKGLEEVIAELIPIPTLPAQPAAAKPTPILLSEPSTPTRAPAPVVIVQADKVNVRKGPGTAYNTTGQVTQGTSLEIVGKNAAGDWWQVCCVSGQQVWIIGRLVQAQGDTSTVQVVASVPPPPPTATLRPLATPAAPTPTPQPRYVYNKALLQRCEPNAGVTAIEGTVYQNHKPFNGARVVFSYAPDAPVVSEMISGPHTGYSGWNAGFYSHVLQASGPREGDWYVWVVDDGGKRISELSPRVHTDAQAGAGTCQKAVVDFDTN